MNKRPMSYRLRMLLKSHTTKASATHTITGQKKTTHAPKPVTLAKVAQK